MPLVAVHATSTVTEIDTRVSATVSDFKKRVQQADEHLKAARAVLVIPNSRSAASGEWIEGALRVGTRTVAYYRMQRSSASLQAYSRPDYLFVFYTDDELERFRSEDDWIAGVDTGINFVGVGAGASPETLRSAHAVGGFSFDQTGPRAGWSARGAKFSKFRPW
jgi:lipid-binding SYLF domain-containing protein